MNQQKLKSKNNNKEESCKKMNTRIEFICTPLFAFSNTRDSFTSSLLYSLLLKLCTSGDWRTLRSEEETQS
uniref:Uncharacterized protein n=1 Tax=Nelumbo nucifera TaxID=4432 RepID=A0A822Z6Q5_NELNU|nr:TPA_asm: hypothetical protein HUJ06_013458 [Nelumbo nucifera]